MIGTKQNEKAKPGADLELIDNSSDLEKESPGTLELVRAAMAAGLTEFTTPTPQDGQGRIDWKVRKWFVNRGGEPHCVLVAQMVMNEHFEVVGPDVDLKPSQKSSAKA
jgi:hypothetical protein